MMLARTSSLPRNFTIIYGLLIVYACLYPFSGWRDNGLPLFDYLFAPWPRYFLWSDLILNVLGYVPLGFLIVLAQSPSRTGWSSVLIAVLISMVLSFSLETIQNFLPIRVASNLDLALNVLGGFVGAMLAVPSRHVLFGPYGILQRWRHRHFIPGRTGQAGLLLLGLWLLGQFTPDNLLFGSGDLRSLFGIPAPFMFKAERFIAFETGLVASTIVAVGLLMRCMMRSASVWPVVLLLVLGVGVKVLATTLFFIPGDALAWLTPGAQAGLFYGGILLFAGLWLPRVLQHAIAGTALLIASILMNLLPRNPYLMQHRPLINRDSFFNLHGVTQFVDTFWPFLALAYLLALGLWRGQHLIEGRYRM